jgi:hypothetical protein
MLVAFLLTGLPSLTAGAGAQEHSCTGNKNGDGRVSVDEVVAVVSNALNGCALLRWYLDCPVTPILGNQSCPSSVVFCTEEEEGEACSDPGVRCCPQGSLCRGSGVCNKDLICTDRDPAPPGGCRWRSRRQYKRDIEYLAASDLNRLRSELLAINLTRFRYEGEEPTAPSHLGFIIEDVEPSPCVDAASDSVDLYGYISMAVGTLQVQQRELKALRREVDALRKAQDHEQIPPMQTKAVQN